MKNYIRHFNEVDINDVPTVGGKNASLGEMFQKLTSKGVQVPDGFATTADAYWDFLQEVDIKDEIFSTLAKLDIKEFSNLKEIGASIRKTILDAELPDDIKDAIGKGYDTLSQKYKGAISLAVRSSATAEDLPKASFAGQQDNYLNIKEKKNLLMPVKDVMHHCSLIAP